MPPCQEHSHVPMRSNSGMLERELNSCSSVAAPLPQMLVRFHLLWHSSLIVFYEKITAFRPGDARSRQKKNRTTHMGHHNNTYIKTLSVTGDPKKDHLLAHLSD